MRKVTQFIRMKRVDCYYGSIEWGTPIGSVQVLDREDSNTRFDLKINGEVVMTNKRDFEIVQYVNKLIKG